MFYWFKSDVVVVVRQGLYTYKKITIHIYVDNHYVNMVYETLRVFNF